MVLGIVCKAHAALVVPKQRCPVNIITNGVQQILNKTDLSACITESHELGILATACDSSDYLLPPHDGCTIEEHNHARGAFEITLTNKVGIGECTQGIFNTCHKLLSTFWQS